MRSRLEDVLHRILRAAGREAPSHERSPASRRSSRKEVRRFLRVPGQTVLCPLITTTLYFVVFGYSLGGRVQRGRTACRTCPSSSRASCSSGIANNAFLNTSSSLFITKIQGTIVDLLVAPLGPRELLVGFVGGAMVRGLVVGVLTWVVAAGLRRLPARAPARRRSASCC